mmetsp:Transcript_1158/g.3024  ORF Transcript_1158/g.3024 Transcript_1158/m.3024 type:complete len:103 (+) Transcript_1158:339-647(+)
MPPGWFQETASQVLQMGFLGTIIASFAGDYVLPPPVAAILNENKGAAVMAAMGMNMIAGKLVSTGAFEVLVNGIPIHSKISSGRFPSMPEALTEIHRLTTSG